MVNPKAIYEIDLDAKVIRARRVAPNPEVLAVSHRWERLPNRTEFRVEVDGEDSYPCKLTTNEADNLVALLEGTEYLWVDYVCICQTDERDKSAQISIMGDLYLQCTTCIVGPELDPNTPPDVSYWRRAWCVQEKTFGPMKIFWSSDELDAKQRRCMGLAFLDPIPYADAAIDKITAPYNPTEDWRVGNLRKAQGELPDAIDELNAAIACMKVNDQAGLADASIAIRSKANVTKLANYSKWHWNMFNVDCTHAKDVLYGVWGVPTATRGVQLSYDDPSRSWLLVRDTFPEAAFAYTKLADRGKPKFSTNVDKRIFNLLGGEGGTERVRAVVYQSRTAHRRIIVTCNDDGDVGCGPYEDRWDDKSQAISVCFTMRSELIQPQGKRDLKLIESLGKMREILPIVYCNLHEEKVVDPQGELWRACYPFQDEVIPYMWKVLDGEGERREAM